jgi:hypothetical protein
MLPPNIRKRGEVVMLETEVKWPRREFDEVKSCWNRIFASSRWTMAADVERRVALKLLARRLVREDVGKRVKKVWRPSPICGQSYGRWCDWWRGVAMVIYCAFCVNAPRSITITSDRKISTLTTKQFNQSQQNNSRLRILQWWSQTVLPLKLIFSEVSDSQKSRYLI